MSSLARRKLCRRLRKKWDSSVPFVVDFNLGRSLTLTGHLESHGIFWDLALETPLRSASKVIEIQATSSGGGQTRGLSTMGSGALTDSQNHLHEAIQTLPRLTSLKVGQRSFSKGPALFFSSESKDVQWEDFEVFAPEMCATCCGAVCHSAQNLADCSHLNTPSLFVSLNLMMRHQ